MIAGDVTARPIIRGVLFDKDGTLINYQASWAPTNLSAGRLASEGDAELAARLLIIAGVDPATGYATSDGLLASGNTEDVAQAWTEAGSPFGTAELTERLDILFRSAVVAAVHHHHVGMLGGDTQHPVSGAADDQRRPVPPEALLLHRKRGRAAGQRSDVLGPEPAAQLGDRLGEPRGAGAEPLERDARRVELPLHVARAETDLQPPAGEQIRRGGEALIPRVIRVEREVRERDEERRLQTELEDVVVVAVDANACADGRVTQPRSVGFGKTRELGLRIAAHHEVHGQADEHHQARREADRADDA